MKPIKNFIRRLTCSKNAGRWPQTLFVLLFSVVFLFVGNRAATVGNKFYAGAERAETYYRAKITAVSDPEIVEDGYGGMEIFYVRQTLTVRLLEGAMSGEDVEVTVRRDRDVKYKVYDYKSGQKILVGFNFDERAEPVWYVADHLREDKLALLVALFFVLLAAVGRTKGVRTIISLCLTFASIFLVLIPGIIKGYNIYLLTTVVSVYIVFATLALVFGPGPKSISAALGCFGGISVAAVVTVLMQNFMKITGVLDEEAAFVMFINPETTIDLRGIIFASIVIGAVGAIMDVSVSLASSLEEMLSLNPDISDSALIKSGMNISSDMIGTMSNTLVLAYAGSSLHVVLLYTAYNFTMGNIINREKIAVEVLQAVAGSLGVLLALPLTIAAVVLLRDKIAPAASPSEESDGEPPSLE